MGKINVRPVSFEVVAEIWKNHLWHQKSQPIKPQSSLLPNGQGFDRKIYDLYSPVFFGVYQGSELGGVISGHATSDIDYRIRGLYVFEAFYGLGFGSALVASVERQARHEEKKQLWSYPRKSGWPFYQALGFVLTSEWSTGEIEENATVTKALD